MTLNVIDTSHAPEKPRFGEPCNGCGFCCASEVCKVGLAMFGDDTPAPCPAMVYSDGRFWCGIVEAADATAPGPATFLRLLLGVGLGCDSED